MANKTLKKVKSNEKSNNHYNKLGKEAGANTGKKEKNKYDE